MTRARPSRPTPKALHILALLALAGCQPQAGDVAPDPAQALVDDCILSDCATLRLDFWTLSDYRQLARLNHVTDLMLSGTDIADLSDLAGMSQLEALHIGDTRLRDLSALATLPNLRLLHMQGIRPVSWEPVTGLSSLRELAVGTLDMTDLSFVARMPGLQRLHLALVDAALDLSTLGAHPGLRAVHFGDESGLSSLPDLRPLLGLPNLREVSLVTFAPEDHADEIAALRARGVRVTLTEPVIVVC